MSVVLLLDPLPNILSFSVPDFPHMKTKTKMTKQNSLMTSSLSRPGVNFINLLSARFSSEILVPKTSKLCFGFEIFGTKILCEKRMRKMLQIVKPVI